MRFLLGLALGYVVGIIIAPASGEETRRQLAEKVDTTAREKAREIGQRAGEKAYEEIKARL